MHQLAIASCIDYDPTRCKQALERVVDAVGGLDWVKPGMRIGIKANLVAGLKPEAAATTHPELLRAIVAMIESRGATAVIGDSPSGLYNAIHVNRVYHATGLDTVGAELNSDFATKEIHIPNAKTARDITVTQWLMNCDGIINFCKLKSHGMMGMSGAAKNLFGTIPGTMKPEYHFRFSDPNDFADMIVDLDEYWKPHLHLVDAVVGMEGNGPTAGTPKPLGFVIAGKNPHQIDLLCAKMIGLDPATVPTLCAAHARGLLDSLTQIPEVVGPWRELVSRDFETIRERSGLQFQNLLKGRSGLLFSRFAQKCIAPRPGVEKSICIGCQKCRDVCPAKAIRMKNGKPRIDRSRCIRCFCCQEFCPKGAMKVKRPPVARMISHG